MKEVEANKNQTESNKVINTNSDGTLDDSVSASEIYMEEQFLEQDEYMMIDLWKKLQDLLRIQTQEEIQDAKEKIKKQRMQKLKYYKV